MKRLLTLAGGLAALLLALPAAAQPRNPLLEMAASPGLSQADRARDAASAMMGFFRDESCGQCTPCRVGTAKAHALLGARNWDGALLEELSQAMADASICGLGQAAPNPIRCVLEYFPHEVGAEVKA